MKGFHYLAPTEMVFGAGSFDSLKDQCARFGSKAFIVTGKNSSRKNGALDSALRQLPNAVVFDDVQENPTSDTCNKGGELCRNEGCDLVVAIGGGSPMDAAKAISVLALNAGDCSDFYGSNRFNNGALPIIAVPTTAGTGSEVTPYAVIINSSENKKRTISGQDIFPKLAILDPELSLTMPQSVTANTGLDALSQAMEGIVSLKSTPLSDLLALEACRIVCEWLPKAVGDGTDIEARSQMLYAASLTGHVISQTGTTLVHGMGYYLTIEFGIAHGLANAFLLPPIFRHNAMYLPDKVAEIARALGYVAETSAEDSGEKVVEAIYSIFARIGVAPAAKEAGARLERLNWCAEDIINDKSRFKNQPGEFSLEQVKQIFFSAYEGRI